MDKARKIVILVLCLLECFLFGGTIFGWNMLVFTLKSDGIYKDACPSNQNVTIKTTKTTAQSNVTGDSTTNIGHSTKDILRDNANSWSNNKVGPSPINKTCPENVTCEIFNNGSTFESENATKILDSSVWRSASDGKEQNIMNNDKEHADNGSERRGLGRDGNIDCNARSNHFSLAFTIATVLMGLSALPLGWLFDKAGLSAIRMLASLLAIPGFLMLALVEPEYSVLIYPASAMIGLVAFIVMVTNFHAAQLAGNWTSTMAAFDSGSVSMSGMVLLFVKLLNETSIDRRTCLLFITGLWMVVLVSTVLLPRHKVIIHGRSSILPTPVNLYPDPHQPQSSSTQTIMASLESLSVFSSVLSYNAEERSRNLTFRESALSSTFFLHLYFFSINHLKSLYFIGTFNQWASQVTNDDRKEVSKLIDVYGFAHVINFLMAPCVGMIMDRKVKSLNESSVYGMYRGIVAAAPLILTCCLQITFSVAVLMADHWSVMAYVAIGLAQATRGVFYASAFIFIAIAFPPKHFGKLVGITYLTGGAASFLQPAFLAWANTTGSHTQPNIALLVLATFALAHPALVTWKYRRFIKTD